MQFSLALNTALLPLLHHGPGDGRTLRKLAVIRPPLRRPPDAAPGDSPNDVGPETA